MQTGKEAEMRDRMKDSAILGPPPPDDDDFHGVPFLDVDNSHNSHNSHKVPNNNTIHTNSTLCESIHTIEKGNIATAVKEYILENDDDVSVSQIYQYFGFNKSSEKMNVRNALRYYESKGLIEKTPVSRGVYRVCGTGDDEMDLDQELRDDIPIEFPFRIHQYSRTLQGSLIVIFGSFNSGKTSVIFDILRRVCVTPVRNALLDSFASAQESHERSPKLCRYINSEMEVPEIQDRLIKMGADGSLVKKNTSFIKRNRNYHRAIWPNAINVVDFVSLSDEFYRIGSVLDDIQQALGSGIAIVCLQKKRGETAPRGGDFALERCRFALDLDQNNPHGMIAKVVKHKIPVDGSLDFQGWEIDYTVDKKNLRINEKTSWRIVEPKDRKKINDRYTKDKNQFGDE